MNISATINVFRLIRDPTLCLAHCTIPSFNDLQIPLSKAINGRGREVDIQAVVLDKDDCFAKSKENIVFEPYIEKFKSLRTAYPGSRLLIVSNSAGTGDDPNGKEAEALEKATGVTVLRHSTKKPGCWPEVLRYFHNAPDAGVIRPSQIAIVGDRLSTDVMMASMMGSWSICVGPVAKQRALVGVHARTLLRSLTV